MFWPLIKRSDIAKYFAKYGKRGGKLRAQKLTKEQRAESARKAAQVRWDKAKKKH